MSELPAPRAPRPEHEGSNRSPALRRVAVTRPATPGEIAVRLSEAMAEKGITGARELAAGTPFSTSCAGRTLRGKQALTQGMVVAFARSVGLEYEDLAEVEVPVDG